MQKASAEKDAVNEKNEQAIVDRGLDRKRGQGLFFIQDFWINKKGRL